MSIKIRTVIEKTLYLLKKQEEELNKLSISTIIRSLMARGVKVSKMQFRVDTLQNIEAMELKARILGIEVDDLGDGIIGVVETEESEESEATKKRNIYTITSDKPLQVINDTEYETSILLELLAGNIVDIRNRVIMFR